MFGAFFRVADVNGDNKTDIIFSDYSISQVTVILGTGTWVSTDYSSISSSRIITITKYGDFGYAIDTGDVNGDGITDILIGSTHGLTCVVYGRSDLSSMSVSGLPSVYGYKISEFSTDIGSIIRILQDINGDGVRDMYLGSVSFGSMRGYVVYGQNGTTRTGVNLLAVWQYNGYTLYGVTLSSTASDAGDVDGDGINDFMVGSRPDAASYVVYGSLGTRNNMDLSTIDRFADFKIVANPGPSEDGFALGGRDLNGDGIPDLVAGTIYEYAENPIYAIYGTRSRNSSIITAPDLAPDKGYVVPQARIDGMSRSAIGDVNDDGGYDLILYFMSSSEILVIKGYSLYTSLILTISFPFSPSQP